MITSVLEDYLKIILELEEKEGFARVTDIADRLNVAKPTVCVALKRLKQMGYISKDIYGPVCLTDTGKEYAIKIRKRFIVIREFLTNTLGVDDNISEKDACKLEHVISLSTLEILEDFMKQNI